MHIQAFWKWLHVLCSVSVVVFTIIIIVVYVIVIFNVICLLHYSFETQVVAASDAYPVLLLFTLHEDPLVIMYSVRIITYNN